MGDQRAVWLGYFFPSTPMCTLLVLCPDDYFCVSISQLLCPLFLLPDICNSLQKTIIGPPEPHHPVQGERWQCLGVCVPQRLANDWCERMKAPFSCLEVGQTLGWLHSRKTVGFRYVWDFALICTLTKLSPLPCLGSPILLYVSPEITFSIIHLHMNFCHRVYF